ncbi:MAG TPA: hypothetical protein DCZ97_09785 [Syntrophus sp. (in: bacteria)]|nr:MAG: hypothetical protein A2X92_00155 [Syntrophus sp. GWC2_56_31]HBB17257.1 hypothetical protein [Syntrophus sp. (in: bacteria)]
MIFPDTSFQLNLLRHEAVIRTGCSLILFAVIAISEMVVPRRLPTVKKSVRWFGNISIHLMNGLLPRLLFPILPVGMALLWAQKGWGLLNIFPLTKAAAVLVTVLMLDLLIYAQHVLFHRLRFHPLEIVVSLLIKMAAVALLGPPALAVLIFEVLLNGMAMFNHGNFRIPERPDLLLRRIVVTPDMHLVHHSTVRQESDRNFGFNFSWWDRFFGTYKAEPSAGREGMIIGLTGFRDVRYARFWKMILNPFEKG